MKGGYRHSIPLVLLGLMMCVASAVVSLYLGLLLRGQRDWRTAVGVLLLLAAKQ
jgi:hypothetical protein